MNHRQIQLLTAVRAKSIELAVRADKNLRLGLSSPVTGTKGDNRLLVEEFIAMRASMELFITELGDPGLAASLDAAVEKVRSAIEKTLPAVPGVAKEPVHAVA